jgi:hypothetical protein
MAVGDIKNDECIFMTVVFGTTVAIGDVVHLEADGKWDPVADSDKGKFGMAIDAGGDGDTGRILVFGEGEVKATGSVIPKGAVVMAGTAGTVAATDFGTYGESVGTAMTAFDASGNGTVFFGMVG